MRVPLPPALAAAGLLGLLAAAAQAVPDAPAVATGPDALARPETAGAAMELDLSRVPPEQAAALAELVPEWEEAISAGTERITVSAARAAQVRAAGFDVSAAPSRVQALPPWPGCYHTADEIYAWARAYADLHPDLLELVDIGDSHCKQIGGCTTPAGDAIPGRDILALRVTAEGASAPKEGRLWVDGGLHSREIPTVELMRAWVMHLVEGYGQDPLVTYLLDHREIHVGLMSNPDGRALVELGAQPPYDEGPWMWRKNANDADAPDEGCAWPPSSGNQHGIDLNRNQAFKWDEEGHSTNPCSATYRGTEPASEVEIQAYEAYVESLFPDQRGPADDDPAPEDATGFLINFHNATYPGTVLVPWGWTEDPSPNDADLLAIGQRYAMHNGYNVQYSLYPVSGNTRDWSYGVLGIPSYVIELQGATFVGPCTELAGVIAHNLPPLRLVAGLADRPYRRINGPEVSWLRGPEAVTQGDTARIVARLSELRSGGQTVSEARLAIAAPGGAAPEGATAPGAGPDAGWAMAPRDGAFDERTETAVLELDTSDLPPGRYYLTVRGADDGARWGAAEAVWLDVAPALAAPSPGGDTRPAEPGVTR